MTALLNRAEILLISHGAKLHTSQPWSKSIRDHFLSIDWDLHGRKPYVVIDPIDPQGVLYLSANEYQAMVRTCLSTGDPLVVVARPGSKPEDSTPPKGGKSGTPLLNRKLAKAAGSSMAQALLKTMFKKDAHMRVKDGMVEPTEGNLRGLIIKWGRILAHWSGKKLRPAHFKELSELSKYLLKVLRDQGPDALIQRLKIGMHAVYRYIGGQPLQSTHDLGCRIGLANGLPRFLPRGMRARIRARSTVWIRIIASLLNAYKALKGPYPAPSAGTIEAPPFEGSLGQFVPYCRLFWRLLPKSFQNPSFSALDGGEFNEYVPHIPLASGPNNRIAYYGIPLDTYAWVKQPFNWVYLWAKVNNMQYLISQFDFHRRHLSWLYEGQSKMKRAVLGKLALRFEAAGKVRVFAIGNYWTQRALLPVHKWLFSILKTIGPDGTFDQDGAIATLAEKKFSEYFCYDLKSATDLIPRILYQKLLEVPLGEERASIWDKLMSDVDFRADAIKRGTYVRYTRGQPMGFYSSWAALALVHHCLVQFAAYRSGHDPKVFFEDYRIVGDDIVIANRKVAMEYVAICQEFGITIGHAKGIVSPLGLINFVARYVLDGTDISPASLKEELSVLSSPARFELVARLVRRGWAGDRIVRALRLVFHPEFWEKEASKLSRGVISPCVGQVLRTMLAPTSSVMKTLSANTPTLGPWLTVVKPPVGVIAGLDAVIKDQAYPVSADWHDDVIKMLATEIVTRSFNKLKAHYLSCKALEATWFKSPSDVKELIWYSTRNSIFNPRVFDYEKLHTRYMKQITSFAAMLGIPGMVGHPLQPEGWVFKGWHVKSYYGVVPPNSKSQPAPMMSPLPMDMKEKLLQELIRLEETIPVIPDFTLTSKDPIRAFCKRQRRTGENSLWSLATRAKTAVRPSTIDEISSEMLATFGKRRITITSKDI